MSQNSAVTFFVDGSYGPTSVRKSKKFGRVASPRDKRPKSPKSKKLYLSTDGFRSALGCGPNRHTRSLSKSSSFGFSSRGGLEIKKPPSRVTVFQKISGVRAFEKSKSS